MFYALFRPTASHDGTSYIIETPTVPAGQYNFSFYYSFPRSSGHMDAKLVSQTGVNTAQFNVVRYVWKPWEQFSTIVKTTESFKASDVQRDVLCIM